MHVDLVPNKHVFKYVLDDVQTSTEALCQYRKNGCYFLTYADTHITSTVKTEQPEVVPLYIGLLTTVVW